MKDKKYIFTDETITYFEIVLHRIQAVKDFGTVKKGDLGGFIQSEENLSHKDTCWVADNAKVLENAVIMQNAQVYGNAWVFGSAVVFSNAKVYGDATIRGAAQIFRDAQICNYVDVSGNAKIYCGVLDQDKSYICIGPMGSRNAHTTFFKANGKIMVACGCFLKDIEEFELAVHKKHHGCRHETDYMNAIKFAKEYLMNS